VETKTVFMPRELTAENGAKGLMTGEFYEEIRDDCPYCDGTGSIDARGHEPCDECGGDASYMRKIPVSWTTIKEIYAMAVKHLGH